MKAAAATLPITPGHPLPLAGYTGREGNFEQVDSGLEANILVLDDGNSTLAIVSIDTLFAGEELAGCVRSSAGYKPVRLLLVASHTHSAPGLYEGKPLLGSVNPAYLEAVGHSIGATIERLVPASVPANFHYGHTLAKGNMYRRRNWIAVSRKPLRVGRECVMAPNPNAKTHTDLQMIVIGDPRAPTAVIWSWPCHPVAAPGHAAVSADFPGMVRTALRNHFGKEQLPVLYLPGFCGDIRPDIRGSRMSIRNIARHAMLPIVPFAPNSPETFRTFCEAVARSAVTVADRVVQIDSSSVLRTASSGFPIGRYMEPQQDISMDIVALRAGEFSAVFVGAEVCSPYYDLLGHDATEPCILTGYTGSVFGYLPTETQVAEGGYEAGAFFPAFGLKGRFTAGIEKDFTEAVTALRGSIG